MRAKTFTSFLLKGAVKYEFKIDLNAFLGLGSYDTSRFYSEHFVDVLLQEYNQRQDEVMKHMMSHIYYLRVDCCLITACPEVLYSSYTSIIFQH